MRDGRQEGGNLDGRQTQERDRAGAARAGSGTISVNERALEVYFPRDTSRMKILEPFELTETKGHYDVIVSVAAAVSRRRPRPCARNLARAGRRLEALRPVLRKGGMLTRDPREVERNKYGRHKARKRPQYSKR